MSDEQRELGDKSSTAGDVEIPGAVRPGAAEHASLGGSGAAVCPSPSPAAAGLSTWSVDIARNILDDLAAQPCEPERLRVFIERWHVCLDGLARGPAPGAVRPLHLTWNGTEWVDDRCGCRYHPDDDNGSHGGAPHVHRCERHTISNAAVGGEHDKDHDYDAAPRGRLGRPNASSLTAPAAEEVALPGEPPEGLVPDKPGWWWRRRRPPWLRATWVWLDDDGHLRADEMMCGLEGNRAAYVSELADWRGPCLTLDDLAAARAEEREQWLASIEERATELERTAASTFHDGGFQDATATRMRARELRRLAGEMRGAK